ncbi:MAG TPA: DUF2752 domain-containing protein [Bacteroidia bacterium]|jgi:hypothetical protein
MQDLIHWLEAHLLSCPYKALTGFDCPGCGMQRSFIELLKGNLTGSFMLYPALLPVIFTLLFTGLHLAFRFKKGAEVIKYSFLTTTAIIVTGYILKMWA